MNNSKPWDNLSDAERARKVIEEFERTGIDYSFGPGGIQFDGFVDSKPNDLKDYATWSLVEELMKRIAVETVIVHPHEKKDVTVDGPAIVLLVYD